MRKTWFITGASRGLGRAFTQAALDRGDLVTATARSPQALADLHTEPGQLLRLPLDVTDSAASAAALREAADHFGRLDVVVNNAGHGQLGAVEEITEASFRAVMDVNFFAPVAICRHALPILRAQDRGHIINISSMGGLLALPLAGPYIASKWALEGLSETLAAEVEGFGIAVTLVEPGPFATDQGSGSNGPASSLDAYRPVREAQAEQPQLPPEDPAAAAAALLRVVDAPDPPRRVIFGRDGLIDFVDHVYADRLAGWRRASSYYDGAAGARPA